MVQPVQRRGRIEHQAGLQALFADQANGAIHMFAGFRMKADDAGAGLGKIGDDPIYRLDHQMHINGCSDPVFTQRLADQGADGQVRHVVVVHHVEMHPVSAGREHFRSVLAQPGEIGRQDGGGNDWTLHGNTPARQAEHASSLCSPVRQKADTHRAHGMPPAIRIGPPTRSEQALPMIQELHAEGRRSG